MKKTIIGFGDSLTFGYGVGSGMSFIDKLAPPLSENFPSFEWKIINKGVNGDTTRDALFRLKEDVLDLKPDYVTILFGTNDSSFNEDAYISPFEFSANLNKIAASIKEIGAIPIFITPPPIIDSDFMPYNTNDRIEKYCSIISEAAEKCSCPILDLNDFMSSFCGSSLEELLQLDGIHINEKGYEIITEFIIGKLSNIIETK
ncbi:MAG: SGNH/GDSL hydrolase family protein [Lachnospiraceae bacterium]|nr:SGNH/GDSL hydrolase family protein [Lachnospiraceae bacterium]